MSVGLSVRTVHEWCRTVLTGTELHLGTHSPSPLPLPSPLLPYYFSYLISILLFWVTILLAHLCATVSWYHCLCLCVSQSAVMNSRKRKNWKDWPNLPSYLLIYQDPIIHPVFFTPMSLPPPPQHMLPQHMLLHHMLPQYMLPQLILPQHMLQLMPPRKRIMPLLMLRKQGTHVHYHR